jgi:GLPGLI family protein
MKRVIFIVFIIFLFVNVNAQQPKIIGDCTLSYLLSRSDKTNQAAASSTVYIKGKDVRVDFINNSFSQTIFYNGNLGNATILKTVGQSKYIANYTAAEWQKENEVYKDATVSFTNNTKKILDYECKEAVITLKNGKSYSAYFTPRLVPTVKANPFANENIPGLILEYELLTDEKDKIFYSANSMNFNPVPAVKFEIPKSGYRIIH